MIASAHLVVRLGLLHMRQLQRWFVYFRLHSTRNRQTQVSQSQAARLDLEFSLTLGRLQLGASLGCIPHYTEVFTDTSLARWGGTLCQSTVGRAWELPLAFFNVLEMVVQRMLLHFCPRL